MRKVVRSVEGDTVCRLLLRELGDDSDEIEREFWRVNPEAIHLPPVFPVGSELVLPSSLDVDYELNEAVRAWD